jgi:hypothetical protein
MEQNTVPSIWQAGSAFIITEMFSIGFHIRAHRVIPSERFLLGTHFLALLPVLTTLHPHHHMSLAGLQGFQHKYA